MKIIIFLLIILFIFVPLVKAQTTPVPGYYITFTQPPSGLNGNIARWVIYGPEGTIQACLNSLIAIMNASSGIGSIAWGYQPYSTCYKV